MIKDTFLTTEGLKKIEGELEELKIKRREISARIQEAKELGDLSENAEYHEAKNEQAFAEGRIVELEAMLHHAKIIEKPSKRTSVQIGSTISVSTEVLGKQTYTIVGSNEANPKEGFISNESPLGRSFLGKKKGEIVAVHTPKGIVAYTISDIT